MLQKERSLFKTYDARGNGDGDVTCTLTGSHQSTISDYTAIVVGGAVEPVAYRGDAITSPVNASNPRPGDPCHTLTDDSRNYIVEGGGEMDEVSAVVRRLTPL